MKGHPLRRRRQDPSHASSDSAHVLEAAALLDIAEFEVFRQAYRRWHGFAPSDETLEPIYLPYMFKGEIPIWVRDYCRAVLRAARDERLDIAAFGVRRATATRAGVSRGVRYGLVIALFVVVLIIVAHLVAPALAGRCMFPPCY